MRTRYIACTECGRHVKQAENACPFCGAASPPPSTSPIVLAPGTRVARAAMLAAGAAGGILVMADCGNTSGQAFYGVACTPDACPGVIMTDASDGSRPTAEAGVADAAGDAADAASETGVAGGDASAPDAGDAAEDAVTDAAAGADAGD